MSPRRPLSEDEVTEVLVMAFIELIHERKLAGRTELVATMETIAGWISERTALPVTAQHIASLTQAMREGGLITVGGYGIGQPNAYDTCEDAMGEQAFWDQVDAFLTVWKHPGRRGLAMANRTG